MIKGDNILFLGAHADDEIACAGTLARLVEENRTVHFACFSFCQESVPIGYDPEILKTELTLSFVTLGINSEHIHTYNFPVRRFPEYRQEILERMIALKNEINPDVVLLPNPADRHQDHMVIAIEGMRALKQRTILGYELPRNVTTFTANGFVVLEESHVMKKLAVMRCYKSQQRRAGIDEDYLRGLLRVRGVQCGEKYAEAFDVMGLKI